MKKLMIPALAALMSVAVFAEDAAKPADAAAAPADGACKAVGGGEKDSVTFKTDVLEAGGDYDFFCSFPGHYAVMRGKVVVE